MTRLRSRNESPEPPAGVEEGSVVTVFRVPPEMAGMRLDQFLQNHLKRTSRTRTQEIIKASAYGSAGQRLRSNHRVLTEERIFLWRAPWDEDPVPQDLPVLYEDDFVLAINKPSGVPVHPTARYHKNTVIKMLEALRPDQHLSLGHRIDRETSGVLLLSKTPRSDSALKRLFMDHDCIQKTYRGITYGVPPEAEFVVDSPLELDLSSATKVKMRVARPGRGLVARTTFRVKEVRRRGDERFALLDCDLHTGRQHQIRVHLASIGFPLVGDKLYAFDESLFTRDRDGQATDDDREKLLIERHALHAARIALPHPVFRDELVVDAPLPPDIAAFWDSLERAG
jgi:23S rRNA pseudouridine1911/1915/1917 synthase